MYSRYVEEGSFGLPWPRPTGSKLVCTYKVTSPDLSRVYVYTSSECLLESKLVPHGLYLKVLVSLLMPHVPGDR